MKQHKSNADGTLIVNDNLHYIECDLAKDNLYETLKKHGYRENDKSLIILEGLTMYLDELNDQRAIELSIKRDIFDKQYYLLKKTDGTTGKSISNVAVMYLDLQKPKD